MRLPKGRPLLASLLLIAFAAGCAGEPPPRDHPDIGFGHLPPIRLDVARIEVEQLARETRQPPRVEHLFTPPPAQVAETWARQRLQAASPNSERIARVIVREASVIEVALPRTPGIRGAFTTDQSERYDALAIVEVRILNANGAFEGNAEARAERSVTVPENATLGQRESVWFKLTEDLFRDLDQELERNIRSALFRFVVL